MDFHPPQGAHTSYLRTLSKIKGLRGLLHLAPKDISSEGAAYYTSNFLTVNTSKKLFFEAPRSGPEVFDGAGEAVSSKGRAS
jgi:hypothetical protein